MFLRLRLRSSDIFFVVVHMRFVSPSGGRIKEGGLELKKSQIKIYIFYLFLPDIYFTYPPRNPSRGAQPA